MATRIGPSFNFDSIKYWDGSYTKADLLALADTMPVNTPEWTAVVNAYQGYDQTMGGGSLVQTGGMGGYSLDSWQRWMDDTGLSSTGYDWMGHYRTILEKGGTEAFNLMYQVTEGGLRETNQALWIEQNQPSGGFNPFSVSDWWDAGVDLVETVVVEYVTSPITVIEEGADILGIDWIEEPASNLSDSIGSDIEDIIPNDFADFINPVDWVENTVDVINEDIDTIIDNAESVWDDISDAIGLGDGGGDGSGSELGMMNAQFILDESRETARRATLQHDQLMNYVGGVQGSSGFAIGSDSFRSYRDELDTNFGLEMDWLEKSAQSRAEIAIAGGNAADDAAQFNETATWFQIGSTVAGFFL